MEWYRIKKAPLVLGHEIAGVVEEAGEGVTAFKAGDRVVATHHVPCGTCRYCLSGNHNVCETLRTTTFDPGGFSEFVRLPAINVDRGTLAVPEDVSFEEASFVEPLACVLRALRVASLQPGDTVAVLGSGISGALMIHTARELGAGVIVATDISEYRLTTARRLGADLACPADGPVPEEIRQANGGRLADRVLVCTAARPAIEQAFQCVDRGGTILFFAPLEPGATFPVPMYDIWMNGLTIVHSYAGPPADMGNALDLIASRRIDVSSMISHRLGLAETGEGFRLTAAAQDSLKVIIEPQH
jgi:L-iditol 2-dehydrogenase